MGELYGGELNNVFSYDLYSDVCKCVLHLNKQLMERRVWSSAVTTITLKWEGKKKALL